MAEDCVTTVCDCTWCNMTINVPPDDLVGSKKVIAVQCDKTEEIRVFPVPELFAQDGFDIEDGPNGYPILTYCT